MPDDLPDLSFVDPHRRTVVSERIAAIRRSNSNPGRATADREAAALGISVQLFYRSCEALAIAYPRRFVSSLSVRELEDEIEEKRKRTRPVPDARALSECSRLLGGGEKPWSDIIHAIIVGDLVFWGEPEVFDIRRMLVRPDEMRQFLGNRFGWADPDLEASEHYAKREAAEVLTIDPPLFDNCLDELDLKFVKSGRAKTIGKEEVLKVAREVVSNAGLGEHWGVAAKSVRYDRRDAPVFAQALSLIHI